MTVPSNLIPFRITQLPIDPSPSTSGILMYVRDGVTYQVTADQIVSVTGVPTTRQVIAGTGLTGGGQLLNNVTLSVAPGGIGTTELSATGVSPGTYGSGTAIPVVTIDSTGRVTAATTSSFSVSGFVPDTRQVIAGTGLNGGGALSGDVTINADLSDATPESVDTTGSAGVSTDMSRADHKHPAVDLSDGNQVDNILGLSNGGTARSLVADAGGIIWSGADGLYVGPPGSTGQVLVSAGTGEYTWGTVVLLTPVAANVVYAGPTSGPDADASFRSLVSDDIPVTLNGKTIQSATITDALGLTASSANITSLTLDNALGVSDGGTGLDTTPTNGQLLIGNGNGYTLTSLTAGSGVTVTDATGSITIANSAPDQTVVLTQAGGVSITGTYPSFTISSTSTGGTVTSVDVSGGTTGLTFSGGPVTDSGTITMAGTLSISAGGTGASTDSGARTALGLGTMAVQNANSVAITGGDISVGSANITTLTSSSVTVSSGATINGGAVFNETGADVDFRIESDTNSNAFVLDGATGNVGIGGAADAFARVAVEGTAPSSGGFTNQFRADATIPSTTTTFASNFVSTSRTEATSFVLANFSHYFAQQATLGAGSSITDQYGFNVNSTLTGATNNYGFYSNIASGSGRYNFYAAGSADNYFAGDVGIGTTTPSYQLEIYGANTSFRMTDSNPTHNTYVGAGTTSTAASVSVVRQGVNPSNATIAAIGNSSYLSLNGFSGTANLITTESNGDLSIDVGGSERMRIDSSGNVGIGTSTPTQKLDVSGTITGLAVSATTGTFTSANITTLTSSSGTITNLLATTLTVSGNVGIGTTSINYPLTIGDGTTTAGQTVLTSLLTDETTTNGTMFGLRKSAASGNPIFSQFVSDGTAASPTAVVSGRSMGRNNWYAFDGTNYVNGAAIIAFVDGTVSTGVVPGRLIFSTAPTTGGNPVERLRIDASGNVGIGTSSPGQKLTVAGTVESTSGGFKFPDGTTQTSAATGAPTMNIVTGTTQAAVAGNHYVLTNAAATTVTLPATPSAGDVVWVTIANNLTTNVIARNGENINSIAENMTVDSAYAGIQLRYVNGTKGWVFT